MASKDTEMVAYAVWKCKLCSDIRQDYNDMWRHLSEKHGIKAIETYSSHMYGFVGVKQD